MRVLGHPVVNGDCASCQGRRLSPNMPVGVEEDEYAHAIPEDEPLLLDTNEPLWLNHQSNSTRGLLRTTLVGTSLRFLGIERTRT